MLRTFGVEFPIQSANNLTEITNENAVMVA